MRAFVSILIAASAFCLTTAKAATENPDAVFAQANAEYAAKHYRKAIADYESLVRRRQWNASLFYDLGNAYYRAGDLGRAILGYERTLALAPSHPEAEANLRLVRDEARALELQRGWVEEHLGFLTVNQLSWIAAAAFWAALFILVSLWFAKRRTVVWIFLLLVVTAICGLSAFAAYTLETGSAGRDLAIVIGKDVQARLATADNAGTVLVLPPGSEIKILSQRGDWTYAALPNNLRGWIPAATARQVRL